MRSINRADDIPLVDLRAQHKDLKDHITSTFLEVLESSDFVQGQWVSAFEADFAGATGLRHVVGCDSGTAALILTLVAAGIGRGDEVILPSHTFFATAEAVLAVSATPVFADIDPRTYTLDPAAVEAAITKRTAGVIVVHIYGNPADMDRLTDVVDQYQLLLIEDCAQAHLAEYGDSSVGSIGRAGTFSFYPSKNLGAIGDAGLVASQSDEELIHSVRRLLDHGRLNKYEHDIVGFNYRMDALQAAVLSKKLVFLQEWTSKRRALAAQYDRKLKASGFKVIESYPKGRPVYHLYVVEVSNREEVVSHLRSSGIGCGIHYPVPAHRQPAAAAISSPELKVTDRVASRVLSLPMFPELGFDDVDKICANFLEIARR